MMQSCRNEKSLKKYCLYLETNWEESVAIFLEGVRTMGCWECPRYSQLLNQFLFMVQAVVNLQIEQQTANNPGCPEHHPRQSFTWCGGSSQATQMVGLGQNTPRNGEKQRYINCKFYQFYRMDQYKLEYEKGSGTFSVVFTAVSLKTGKQVAIKCMKKKFETLQRVKKLKEIQALNILSTHENIIKLIEALYDQPSGKLALVFELMDMNLYESLQNRRSPLTPERIKLYMFQVLRAIEYMHRKGIFHRDIKPENILIKGNTAKVADLGSCKSRTSQVPYTDYISTRWYRAPECLMTDGYYNQKMDIWGYGCVLFELVTKKPLFPGKDEMDQINRINNILGTPKPELLKKFKTQATHMEINFAPKKGIGLDKFLPTSCPNQLKDFLTRLLAYDYVDRITAEDALKHDYFAEFSSHLDNMETLNNRDFRSTFFTTKQPHARSKDKTEDADGGDSIKTKKVLSKHKNYGSKHNLEKMQQEGILPKIPNTNSNFSHVMDAYKKSYYNKKFSNDLNFALQGKKAM